MRCHRVLGASVKPTSKAVWLGVTDEEEEEERLWQWIDGQALTLPSARLNNAELGALGQGVEHHLFYHSLRNVFTDAVGS